MRIQGSQWTWAAMSQQSCRSQIGRICVFCLGCLLLSYPMIWRTEYHKLQHAQVHLINLQDNIERLSHAISVLKAKQVQWQELQHQMDRKVRLITGLRETGTWIGWLDKATARHDVEVKRMTWPTPMNAEHSSHDFLEMEQFELELTGHFYAILAVFNAITQHFPYLVFSHMNWARTSEDSGQLNVIAKGQMYRFDERRDRE